MIINFIHELYQIYYILTMATETNFKFSFHKEAMHNKFFGKIP